MAATPVSISHAPREFFLSGENRARANQQKDQRIGAPAPLKNVSVRKNSVVYFLQLTEILIAPLFRLDILSERRRTERRTQQGTLRSNRDTKLLETAPSARKQKTEAGDYVLDTESELG